MKKSINYTLTCLTALAFILSSCSKDPIRGCKNSKADNFKSDAEEDDGSCRFSGDFNFAISTDMGKRMANAGIVTVTFFVNGQQIGSLGNTQTITAFPSCADTKNILKKNITFSSAASTFRFKVTNSKGVTEIDEDTDLNLKSSGRCNQFFLQ